MIRGIRGLDRAHEKFYIRSNPGPGGTSLRVQLRLENKISAHRSLHLKRGKGHLRPNPASTRATKMSKLSGCTQISISPVGGIVCSSVKTTCKRHQKRLSTAILGPKRSVEKPQKTVVCTFALKNE